MGVGSNVIALRHFQPKGKLALFARVAVKHRCLRSGWEGGWCRSPLDVLRRDQFMLARLLTNGAASQRCKSDRRHCSNVEKNIPTHFVTPLLIDHLARNAPSPFGLVSSRLLDT